MSIDNEQIAQLRVIRVVHDTGGLVGERAIRLAVDTDSVLYALDFSRELGPNQKIATVESAAIVTGPVDGLTITTGRNDRQARLHISAAEAGSYVVRVVVTFGSCTRSALVTVKVSQ